jgi:hypothetical protein
MQNDAGENVDLYIPRKWYLLTHIFTRSCVWLFSQLPIEGVNLFYFVYSSSTNRLIHAKDHASIQLNLVEVSATSVRVIDRLIGASLN